jgi:hypothetical protein
MTEVRIAVKHILRDTAGGFFTQFLQNFDKITACKINIWT